MKAKGSYWRSNVMFLILFCLMFFNVNQAKAGGAVSAVGNFVNDNIIEPVREVGVEMGIIDEHDKRHVGKAHQDKFNSVKAKEGYDGSTCFIFVHGHQSRYMNKRLGREYWREYNGSGCNDAGHGGVGTDGYCLNQNGKDLISKVVGSNDKYGAIWYESTDFYYSEQLLSNVLRRIKCVKEGKVGQAGCTDVHDSGSQKCTGNQNFTVLVAHSMGGAVVQALNTLAQPGTLKSSVVKYDYVGANIIGGDGFRKKTKTVNSTETYYNSRKNQHSSYRWKYNWSWGKTGRRCRWWGCYNTYGWKRNWYKQHYTYYTGGYETRTVTKTVNDTYNPAAVYGNSYEWLSTNIDSIVTIGAAGNGSQGADAVCRDQHLSLSGIIRYFMGFKCDNGTASLVTDYNTVRERFGSNGAVSMGKIAGYSWLPGINALSSSQLTGEDDGVVNYAGALDCSGNAIQDIDKEIDECPSHNHDQSYIFASIHEDHDEQRNDGYGGNTPAVLYGLDCVPGDGSASDVIKACF
jgi:hypothetical protein